MPPLFVEMKIIKHTFKIPNLEIKNGELIEAGYNEETYTFTLLHKGIGIFEEMSGTPLMAYLADVDTDNMKESIKTLMSKDFIPNLASASYVKIEDNKFHNNRATAEEFKKLPVFNHISDDLDFAMDLIQMTLDCMIENKKAKDKSDSRVNSKKL